MRDIARALDATYAEGDAIAKAIPNELGITIAKALEVNPDLRQRYENEPLVKQVLDLSMALEGLPRHASTHAAGIVISKMPLDEYVPLYSSDKGVATQFNMTTIEELGLLKMDFLGLRNLTVIRDALKMIKENHGVDIDFSSMDYDDPEVYKLIAEGNTAGVFQLESGGMTDFMKNLKPSCFEDIVAGIALYRPGPMDSIPKYIDNKKHPDHIKYVDKALEPILGVTYGCLIYQEQVMQIVRDLGGYSFGRSDLVRRAMSKKKMDVMLEEKEYFINGKVADDGSLEIAGCVRNGVPAAAAETIFEDMVSFASYAFNKSHAAAYAVISYETAYLKAHYPAEFMAALMSSMAGDARHTANYVRNCREMGIPLDPPSVMKSAKNYSAKDGRIRFGLLSVKNVGEGIVEAIIRGRDSVRDAHDVYEFIGAIDAGELNRKAIESLIQAGAFDDINPNRAQMMAVSGDAVQRAQKRARQGTQDQISIFQMEGFEDQAIASPDLPKVADFNKDTKLALEKEMLGVYISGHPLDEYTELIKNNTTAGTVDLIGGSEEFTAEGDDADSMVINTSKFSDGDRMILAGMISGVRTMITRKSQEMARLTIEDFDGVIDAIVFPKVYERNRNLIRNDMIVGVSGRVSFKDESDAEILIEDIVPIEDIARLSRNSGRGGYDAPRDGQVRQAQQTQTERQNRQRPVPNNAPLNDPVKLRVSEDVMAAHRGDGRKVLMHVTDMMSLYPGDRDVLVYLPGRKPVRCNQELRVSLTDELRGKLVQLLGEENVKG